MVESVGYGNKVEITEFNQNFPDSNIKSIDYVYGRYYHFYVDFLVPVEMDDYELKLLALQSGSYYFWDSPEEDIYSLTDGKPV